jgi:hypothetical protein
MIVMLHFDRTFEGRIVGVTYPLAQVPQPVKC